MLTPQQYLLIFFAETFSMKNLISENKGLLLRALKRFRSKNALIRLGDEIMENNIDENFFLVYKGIKIAISEFYRKYLNSVFPSESQSMRERILSEKMKGKQELNDNEIKFLLREMVSGRSRKILDKLEVYPSIYYKNLEHEMLLHFVGCLYDFIFLISRKTL